MEARACQYPLPPRPTFSLTERVEEWEGLALAVVVSEDSRLFCRKQLLLSYMLIFIFLIACILYELLSFTYVYSWGPTLPIDIHMSASIKTEGHKR